MIGSVIDLVISFCLTALAVMFGTAFGQRLEKGGIRGVKQLKNDVTSEVQQQRVVQVAQPAPVQAQPAPQQPVQ